MMANRLWLTIVFGALLFSGWFAAGTTHGESSGMVLAPSQDFPDWLKNGGTLIGLTAGPGIAIWYLWYHETKVKPRMERTYREQIEVVINRYTQMAKETEERHAMHWNRVNTDSRADLHEMMKVHREDISRLTLAIEKLSERMAGYVCRFESDCNRQAG